MDNAAIAPGSPDIAYKDNNDFSTTQPLTSSPGSAVTSEDLNCDEDNIDNIPNTSSTESSDDESTVITGESENNKDAPLIKRSYNVCKIAWKDVDGARKRMKEMERTKLYTYLNTSTNTAMFMLSTYVTLKGSRRRSNKQQVYLLMPPARINAITVVTVPTDYGLHFSLTREPDYVGPKDRRLSSKPSTQEQLSSVQDLATATELTFYLASSVSHGRQDFERLATIFSLENTENRPSRDKKIGNLATLYAGTGGRVINEKHAGVNPPSYPNAALRSLARSKKRRLDRPELDINDEPPSILLDLIRGLYTRFDDFENQLKTRLDTLEESIKQIRNTEENQDVYTPCRYDSSERDFILQSVYEKCEEHLDAFQVKSYEANEDLEKERDYAVAAIREEAKEFESDVHDTAVRFRRALEHAGDAFSQLL